MLHEEQIQKTGMCIYKTNLCCKFKKILSEHRIWMEMPYLNWRVDFRQKEWRRASFPSPVHPSACMKEPLECSKESLTEKYK